MHKGLHKVESIRNMSKNTFSITVERKDLSFIAGQCVNIGLPNTGINREYSSYSGETHDKLEFLIREVEGGQVTPGLRKLQAGDQVEVDGAYGLFTIEKPEDRSRKYTFIGTGTGIAPYHSFVTSYPDLDFKVIHGIRHLDERYDFEDYKGHYTCCVSQETGGDFSGRVTDYLREHPADPARFHYLCGNRNMINEVYDILREQGVSGSHIITEVFF